MSKRERTVLLAAITMGGFLGAFAVSATNIGLPSIQSEFHLSASTLSWIPLAYVLTAAAALMPMGRVGDLMGHRRTFIWGLRAFTVVMLGTALSPSAGWLIGLRAIQGVSSAAVIATSTTIVTFAYGRQERGRAFGLFAAGPYLGMTLGPPLGGIIVQGGGWRYLFLATGVLSLLTCLIPVWTSSLSEWRSEEKEPFDWMGAAIYAGALPAFLLGFTSLTTRWGVGLAIAGALLLGGFLWWESHACCPIFNTRLFGHNRVLAVSNFAAFANYAATTAVTFLLSLYLQYTRGLDARTAGLILVGGAFVQGVFSPVAGRLADRVEARLIACGSMALCFLSLLALGFIGSSTPYAYVIAVVCFLGLGFAFFASPITYVVMGSVKDRDVGMASSTLASVRWAGNNIGLAVSGLILAAMVGSKTIGPEDHAQVLPAVRLTVFIFAGICALGLAALAASFARTRGREGSSASGRTRAPR